MTTGKTTALTRQTFVDKVMSLLFSMLSRLVINCLPRSKRLFISWLQSPSAVIFGGQKKIKSATVSPSIFHEVMGPDVMILDFLMLSFNPTFHSPFSLSSRGSLVRTKEWSEDTFCHKGGAIWISEVVDISPSHLDSSSCFFQPSISHDVLCIEVKYVHSQ